MSFTSVVESFCEGEVLGIKDLVTEGSVTEVVNSLSSVVMVFCGFWGLLKGGRVGPLISLLHALLIINGIGSLLFHGTMMFGFGLADSFSMTLIMAVGLVALGQEMVEENQWVDSKTAKQIVSSFIVVSASGYGVIALILDATSSAPFVFRLLFALPFFPITITLIFLVVKDISGKGGLVGHKSQRKKLWSLAIRILISMAIAIPSWLVDMLLCTKYSWIAYLFLHSVWHLGMAYAALCQFSFIGYLRADNFDYFPFLTFFPELVPILPTVSWKKPKKATGNADQVEVVAM